MFNLYMKKFIFLPHTADIKFQAFGKDINEVFKNCAFAVSYSICEEKIKQMKIKKVKISGKNLENLLYNFLDEIVYLFDSENLLIISIKKIKIIENKKGFVLNAEISFGDSKKYDIKEHIKSVTYSEMFVKQDLKNKRWVAQVVVDV